MDPTTGRPREVEEYATEVLGLDADEAERLFHVGNGLDDLRGIVLALCAQAEHRRYERAGGGRRGAIEAV